MINLIFDKNKFKILTLFSISPGSKFRRKYIKERTELNNVPLDLSLSDLMKTDIIRKERNLYHINFENNYSKLIIDIISKEYKSLKELPLNVYFLLIDFISELVLFKNIDVYLFGSYSKLIYKETSDIDIAFLHGKDFDKKNINKIIQKLEKKYKKNIELHLFLKKEFYKNKKDLLVKEILTNGERLI